MELGKGVAAPVLPAAGNAVVTGTYSDDDDMVMHFTRRGPIG
jgi:hypothetical protein